MAAEQLSYVDPITVNNNDSRFIHYKEGIRAYLESYLMQIPEFHVISQKKYPVYQEIKKIDLHFSGTAAIANNQISLLIKMKSQGTTDFIVKGPAKDIDKIIHQIIQKVQTYLALQKIPGSGMIQSLESFTAHSQALLYLENKPETALTLLQKALAIDKNSVAIYSHYIPLLMRQKKWRDAEKAAIAAMEIAKKNKRLFFKNLFNYYQMQIKMRYAHFWEIKETIEKISRYFEKRGHLTIAFKMLLFQSRLFRSINNNEKAKQFVEYAQKLIKNKLLDGYAAKETGAIHFAMKNYTQAVEKFNEAKNVFEKLKLNYLTLLCQSNVLSAYTVLGKLEDAVKLADKLLIEAKKIKSNPLLYIIHYNYGEIAFRKKEYEKALKSFQSAVIHSRNSENILGTLKTRYMIGRMLIRMKKYAESLKEFLVVLRFSSRLKIDKLSAWTLYYIHLAYLKTNKKAESITYLKQCIDYLGYSQDPAIEIMRKRLENIEKGIAVEDINDDPITAPEPGSASRRDRAIQQREQQPGGTPPAGSENQNRPVQGQQRQQQPGQTTGQQQQQQQQQPTVLPQGSSQQPPAKPRPN